MQPNSMEKTACILFSWGFIFYSIKPSLNSSTEHSYNLSLIVFNVSYVI